VIKIKVYFIYKAFSCESFSESKYFSLDGLAM